MITVPEGKFVKLKISSFFLESFCNGPSLKIRDGQSESSDLLKSFCGRKSESSLFSSGRHLWVRFHSSNGKYLRGTGFNAVFEAVNQCEFSCSEVFIKTRDGMSLGSTLKSIGGLHSIFAPKERNVTVIINQRRSVSLILCDHQERDREFKNRVHRQIKRWACKLTFSFCQNFIGYLQKVMNISSRNIV